jgi:hypothetical protein
MAKIPKNNNLSSLLNDRIIDNSHRGYLGLSMVGHNCLRYLQLCHYWAYQDKISARIQRLFGVGHSAEQMIIDDLKSVGFDFDSDQFQVIGFGGHWKGHIDGKLYKEDDEWLAEFKTHSDKYFKDVSTKGVIASMPKHYGQVTAYMGYTKIKKCLYVAYNKNTSEYYFEVIEFNEDHFKDLQRKESEVLMAESLLPRIGNSKYTWHECRMCSAKDECFGKKEVVKSCRTCTYVDVLPDGIWQCGKNAQNLTTEEQRVGCSEYLLAPMFKDL